MDRTARLVCAYVMSSAVCGFFSGTMLWKALYVPSSCVTFINLSPVTIPCGDPLNSLIGYWAICGLFGFLLVRYFLRPKCRTMTISDEKFRSPEVQGYLVNAGFKALERQESTYFYRAPLGQSIGFIPQIISARLDGENVTVEGPSSNVTSFAKALSLAG